MTEAENIEIKNEARAVFKKYARLKLRDMSDEISGALATASKSAMEVEQTDEDAVMDGIEQKYGNSAPEIVAQVKAMLDNVDAKHSAIIKQRDADINAIVLKYLEEPVEPNVEAPV